MLVDPVDFPPPGAVVVDSPDVDAHAGEWFRAASPAPQLISEERSGDLFETLVLEVLGWKRRRRRRARS